MNKFIVVEVSQLDGEYVNDVKFVNSFDSQEKAQEFINEEHKVHQEQALQRHKYIKEFAVTLPREYIYESDFYFPERSRTTRHIQEYIEYKKRIGQDEELLKNYNPPESMKLRNLYIVEVS